MLHMAWAPVKVLAAFGPLMFAACSSSGGDTPDKCQQTKRMYNGVGGR
jgi:hypothetical protein